MGIIFVVLLASGNLPKDAALPLWVVLACHAAMGLGTLMGGWRIVKTMGQKICKLQPVHGFAAESAGAIQRNGPVPRRGQFGQQASADKSTAAREEHPATAHRHRPSRNVAETRHPMILRAVYAWSGYVR